MLLPLHSCGKRGSTQAYRVKTDSAGIFSLKCTTEGSILHLSDLSGGRGRCAMLSSKMAECGFSGFSDNMKKNGVCGLGSWVPVATASMWLIYEKIAVTLPFFVWLITSIHLSGKHFPKTFILQPSWTYTNIRKHFTFRRVQELKY